MAVIYVRHVPDDLLKAARIEAIKADQTLGDFVLGAIAAEVANRCTTVDIQEVVDDAGS